MACEQPLSLSGPCLSSGDAKHSTSVVLVWGTLPVAERGDPPPELHALSPTSCTHYLELEVQFSLEVVLLTLDGHFTSQLHGHGAIQDP